MTFVQRRLHFSLFNIFPWVKKGGRSIPDIHAKFPEVSKGELKYPPRYFTYHKETILDKIIAWIACRLGIIVHGDMSQKVLEERLQKFDIHRLHQMGPYKNSQLSFKAQELIKKSLNDLDQVIDIHIHGLGQDQGNYQSPEASAWGKVSWKEHFKFLVINRAAGIFSPHGSTEAARKRLQAYARHFPKLKGILLPIHPAFSPKGEVDWAKTATYLNNESAFQTTASFLSPSSKLYGAVSIHPLDPEWKSKLESAKSKGINLVKWMPPQTIMPDSEEMIPFYQKMKELGMVLIAHSGPEHTLPSSSGFEDAGNPLRFRRALQMGVWVILAHSGHHDQIPDLDNPGKKVPGVELYLRLAKEAHEKNWEGKLFGDLAAVPLHYGGDFTKRLLENAEQPYVRLIYGSDYPVTNLIQPRMDAHQILAKAKLLERSFIKPLNEIRRWNPLLASFILTKSLCLKSGNRTLRFPPETYTGRFKDADLSQRLFGF